MEAKRLMTQRPLTPVLTAIALVVSALVGMPTSVAGAPVDRVRVIVSLAGTPALAELSPSPAVGSAVPDRHAMERAQLREGHLRSTQQHLVRQADESGLDVRVIHHLTAVYHGMVIELPQSQLAALKSLTGVRAVHTDMTYHLTLDDSVPLVGAPDVWKRTDPAGHAADGTGMTVAVLDSGIDYNHPDLGAGFGPGHKVVTGHDFVNNDADPMDDNGHGTHVAGIVAGNGRVRGVAPGAELAAYKVTNQHGGAQVTDIIAALDAAVAPGNKHRADVVNLSLGGPGDGTDPLSQAADLAVDAGVVVVASAGNEGPRLQTVRSPAASERVLAVGASASGVTVPSVAMTVPTRQNLHAFRRAYSANAPTTPQVLDVVDVGQGAPADYDGKDVKGKAVLCSNFTALEDEIKLAAFAKERGAAAFLVTLDDTWQSASAGRTGRSEATADDASRHAFGTGRDDGRLDIISTFIPGASSATLRHHLAAGAVRVEISAEDATDQLADFSSRGPSGRYAAKPDVIAPGVDILSTLPGGGHGRFSGTSMAAPHVAGAAALVRQLHPTWSAAQVSSAVAGSAHQVQSDPLSQGAGRLNVPAAARTRVVANRLSLSFGLADLSRDRVERTTHWALTNVDAAGADVSMSVERAGGLHASVRVEPSSGHVAAGKDLHAKLHISLPTPRADGDVTGWVNVDLGRDGTVDLRLPYLLSVRHLSVHVTPDPAPEGTQTTVFVRSLVDLPAVPAVEVTCPGLDRQRPALEPYGTRIWRAVVQVDDDGLCRVKTSAAAPAISGPVIITGEVQFEVAEKPRDDGGGASSWQPLGPNSRGGWLAFGASRDRMAVVPIDSPSVFVTEDRMKTWREIRTMPMAGGRADAIQPDPRDGDGVYVAMNGRVGGDASYEGRMMHTGDGGATWRVLPGPDILITTFAVDDAGVLAVADSNGIRITKDRGTSWTQLPKAWTTLFDLHWIGPDLYVGTDRGLQVIRSAVNGGDSGVKDLFQPPPLGWGSTVAGDSETIVVSSYPSAWLYVSRDGGSTFQQVLEKPGISFLDVELIGDDIYALQGSGDLWVGKDRGATWTSWGDPHGNSVEFDVGRWPRPHPTAKDTVYVASSGAGLYAADRPGDFRRTGVPAAQVYDIVTVGPRDDEALVAGTVFDSFRTELPRDTIRAEDLEWQSAGGEGISRGADAQFLAVSPRDPNVVFKTGRGLLTFNIYRSDDGGVTWQVKASPSEWPTSLMVHPADPRRVYVGYYSLTGSGLLESLDGGESWRKIHDGYGFQALAGDPTNPNRIWAGDPTGLFRSDDGGLSFERIADVPVSAIAVDPRAADNLVIGGRQLFTSRDGGRTLHAASGASLPMWITDLAFDPARHDRVYAATGRFYDELGALKTGRGVLRSDNDGRSWKSMSNGLANTDVNALTLDRGGRYLFAGTAGGSVHRIRVPR